MRFISPKIDYAFKKIFGSQQSQAILISFLNAIVYDGENIIQSLTEKKQGYKPPDLSVEKTKILSLFQAPGFRHGVNLKSKI